MHILGGLDGARVSTSSDAPPLKWTREVAVEKATITIPGGPVLSYPGINNEATERFLDDVARVA